MNVASLELCKELYELSGWDDTDKGHYELLKKGGEFGDEWIHASYTVKTTIEAKFMYREGIPIGSDPVYPAYDLGYLLRKLPAYIPTHDENADDYLFKLQPNFDGNEWEAAYWGLQKALFWERADTPEDAAAKLAIELFKQGILK